MNVSLMEKGGGERPLGHPAVSPEKPASAASITTVRTGPADLRRPGQVLLQSGSVGAENPSRLGEARIRGDRLGAKVRRELLGVPRDQLAALADLLFGQTLALGLDAEGRALLRVRRHEAGAVADDGGLLLLLVAGLAREHDAQALDHELVVRRETGDDLGLGDEGVGTNAV